MEDFETLVIPVDTIAPIIQKVCLLSVSINVRFVCEDLLKKQRNAFLGLEMITWRKSEWMKIGNDRTRDERYWEENTVSIIFFEIAEKGRSIHSIGPLCEPSIFFVGFNQTSRRRVGFSSWIKWKSGFFLGGGDFSSLSTLIKSRSSTKCHEFETQRRRFFFNRNPKFQLPDDEGALFGASRPGAGERARRPRRSLRRDRSTRPNPFRGPTTSCSIGSWLTIFGF